MLATEKYCGGCRAVKPRSEFNKRAASPDGRAFRCRSCTKRYAAKHRAKYPKTPKQLAEQRAYNLKYRAEKRAVINARRREARAEAKRIEQIRLRFELSHAQI